jgi:hypothetical protein
MTRQLSSLAIVLLMLLFGGCTVYPTAPVAAPQPSSQNFDQSWAAAIGAMTDQKFTIVSQDRGSGVIRGSAGTITVMALLQTQANGTVRIAFETTGANQTDPGLVSACQRVTCGGWRADAAGPAEPWISPFRARASNPRGMSVNLIKNRFVLAVTHREFFAC